MASQAKLSVRALIGCSGVLACVGCAPDAISSADVPEASRASAAAAKQVGRFRPEEQPLADLAERVPSFGGLYYDDNGQLIVLVTNEADEASARATARSVLATQRFMRGRSRDVSARVAVEMATYTAAQLAAWRDIAFDVLTGGSHSVVSLDLDERRNRVAVGILSSEGSQTKRAILQAFHSEGVDTSAVVFDLISRSYNDVGTATATSAPSALALPTTIKNSFSDPLIGGIEIQHYKGGDPKLCTLGFVALRNSQLGLVTNSHCSQNMYSVDYMLRYQLIPNAVAVETVDPSGYQCGIRTCRTSDASFNLAYASTQMTVGLIARTTPPTAGGMNAGYGSITIDQSSPYLIITKEMPQYFVVNGSTHKIGATTGWTKGGIYTTCVDHWVQPTKVATCMYESDYVADGGDSGAPVFYFEDEGIGSPNPLRIHLAGIHSGRAEYQGSNRARWSPISRIKSDLGGPWVIARASTLAVPSVSPAVINSVATLTWPAVSGASSYEVFVQDFFQLCDDFGCYVVGTAETRNVVTGTTFTDSRGFTYVLSPNETGANYSQFRVRAFNATQAAYSTSSTVERIGRIN